ncbi:MAG: SGNH/GDSL hydrolase family protein [Fusicatenibacter sp.]|nr:SGNH/GDSL hydrolase family protein [Lachnospiraceae bacterium]MDY2937522.1 SGNH/GDSL hydrolase family protein [Fusicatenibacter sp.]
MLFEDMDRIVFAGDSVTDMDSAQPVGEGLFENVGHSYVRIVENMLAAWYPEIKVRVTNSGISGNTSRDLLSRFERDVVNLKPDWVSICIGINDVWRQFDSPAIVDEQVMPEEYEKNVEAMILSVKEKVKGIFLMTPYYMEPNEEDWMRKRMDEYGMICKKLAEKHGCIFVDLQETFNEYFQYRHSSYIAWDRIHPNQIGATIIAKAFLSHCDFDYHYVNV